MNIATRKIKLFIECPIQLENLNKLLNTAIIQGNHSEMYLFLPILLDLFLPISETVRNNKPDYIKYRYIPIN